MDEDFDAFGDNEILFGNVKFPIAKQHGHQHEMNKIAVRLDLVELRDKQIISDRAWGLFEIAYQYIGGFKSYANAKEMASEAQYIKATYDGPLDDMANFEVEKCLCIMTFNSKFGLKGTGMARNTKTDRMKTSAAMKKMTKDSFRYAWFEASDKAESFMRSLGADRYLIDPNIIKDKVYPNKDIVISPDGKHYSRMISGLGKYHEKGAYGTIRV